MMSFLHAIAAKIALHGQGPLHHSPSRAHILGNKGVVKRDQPQYRS